MKLHQEEMARRGMTLSDLSSAQLVDLMREMSKQTYASVADILIEAADRIDKYENENTGPDEGDTHTTVVNSEHDETTVSS